MQIIWKTDGHFPAIASNFNPPSPLNIFETTLIGNEYDAGALSTLITTPEKNINCRPAIKFPTDVLILTKDRAPTPHFWDLRPRTNRSEITIVHYSLCVCNAIQWIGTRVVDSSYRHWGLVLVGNCGLNVEAWKYSMMRACMCDDSKLVYKLGSSENYLIKQ